MSDALDNIDRLRGSGNRADVLDAIWDLRDLAYDKPGEWQGLTAEFLFQALAVEIDGTADDAVDWAQFSS